MPEPETDRLEIQVDVAPHEAVVTVRGDIDPHSAPRLAEVLDPLLDDGGGPLVIDLAGVDFIDSSGLRVLIAAHRRAEQRELVIRAPSETARRLLQITGLDEHLTVEDAP